MPLTHRIEAIDKARIAQGLSVHQLSDMAQLSASTVYRTLQGKTTPEEYTIEAMETALGITESQTVDSPVLGRKIDSTIEGYILSLQIKNDRIVAHYNMLLASKGRWLTLSFALNIILVMFLLGVLIYDLRNHDIGWIQNQVAMMTGAITDMFKL